MNDSAGLISEPKESIFKFSFAKLIIVIAIISVAVIMTFPTVVPSGRRRIAQKVYSLNNLRNIGLGVVNYSGGHKGELPLRVSKDQKGNYLHGWMTSVLPYLDQVELAKQVNYEQPWNHSGNESVFKTSVPVFLNPALKNIKTESKGYALTHYTANLRLFRVEKTYSFDEISNADGLANTIMLGGINSNFPVWGSLFNFRDPAKGLDAGPNQLGSPFIGGAVNVIFADGSGKSLNKDIDPQILKALSTPDGGEPISATEF